MSNIEQDVVLIMKEIKRVNLEKFTGKMTIEIDMKCGGMGKIAVNLQKNLKNSTKKTT